MVVLKVLLLQYCTLMQAMQSAEKVAAVATVVGTQEPTGRKRSLPPRGLDDDDRVVALRHKTTFQKLSGLFINTRGLNDGS